MTIAMLQSLKCYIQEDSHKLTATFSFPAAAPEIYGAAVIPTPTQLIPSKRSVEPPNIPNHIPLPTS